MKARVRLFGDAHLLARNYLTPMLEKVHSKNSLDCESKILIRQRNSTNEKVYEELKPLLQNSFSGVLSRVSLHRRASLASS